MGEHTASHTPLPWSIGDNPNSQYGCEIVASTKVKARRVVCRLGGPDREANAKMILSAANTQPAVADLVKALEDAKLRLYGAGMLGGDSDPVRSALSRFRELEKGNG